MRTAILCLAILTLSGCATHTLVLVRTSPVRSGVIKEPPPKTDGAVRIIAKKTEALMAAFCNPGRGSVKQRSPMAPVESTPDANGFQKADIKLDGYTYVHFDCVDQRSAKN